MKLATDVTLLFLSVADSDIFVYFFMSQVWTMKLTELTNTCHFWDRFACTDKVNIKEMGNYGFLKILIYLVNGLQSEKKIPILNKFSI